MKDLVLTPEALRTALDYEYSLEATKKVIEQGKKTASSIIDSGIIILGKVPEDLIEAILEHEDFHIALMSTLKHPLSDKKVQDIHYRELYVLFSELGGWSYLRLTKYLLQVRFGTILGFLIYLFKRRDESRQMKRIWKHFGVG